VHKQGFQALLATPPKWRSTHFAIHHVPWPVSDAHAGLNSAAASDLSTSHDEIGSQPVDNIVPRWQLGVVVPKRHARRAVTRSMLKRLLRSGFERRRAARDRRKDGDDNEGRVGLPPGLWLVRLRAPFAVATFISADSPALRRAAAAEFDALLQRVPARAAHAA
jgi:ribonuclease P protein component